MSFGGMSGECKRCGDYCFMGHNLCEQCEKEDAYKQGKKHGLNTAIEFLNTVAAIYESMKVPTEFAEIDATAKDLREIVAPEYRAAAEHLEDVKKKLDKEE